MLDIQNAVKQRYIPDKKGKKRLYYWFSCSLCKVTFKVRSDCLQRDSPLCISCSQRLRPFESIYNQLQGGRRKIQVLLSYEEFIEFTTITSCTYCGDTINWEPYGTVRGVFKSRSYYLDRKDSTGPYSQENCVVCCTRCNKMKSAIYSFEEFLIIGKALKEVDSLRKHRLFAENSA